MQQLEPLKTFRSNKWQEVMRKAGTSFCQSLTRGNQRPEKKSRANGEIGRGP